MMIRAAGIISMVLVAGLAPATLVAAQSDPQRGRAIFEQDCAMCHGQDASGMMGMHPSLRGAVERLSRDGVEITIRRGRDTNPPMPGFENELTDAEINDVIAYLDTLPVGPRNFGGGDEDGMMDGTMDGWMWVWPILFFVVLAAVIVGAVYVARGLGSRQPTQAPPETALQILKERYARGEIDREEFEERRRVLEGHS
jgi:putative membrane protein